MSGSDRLFHASRLPCLRLVGPIQPALRLSSGRRLSNSSTGLDTKCKRSFLARLGSDGAVAVAKDSKRGLCCTADRTDRTATFYLLVHSSLHFKLLQPVSALSPQRLSTWPSDLISILHFHPLGLLRPLRWQRGYFVEFETDRSRAVANPFGPPGSSNLDALTLTQP
eukprot:335952-Rhodomonas_salina.1